jgi:hypothetical protein
VAQQLRQGWQIAGDEDRSDNVEELEEDKCVSNIIDAPDCNGEFSRNMQPPLFSGGNHRQRQTLTVVANRGVKDPACRRGEFGHRKSFSALPRSQYLFESSSPNL